MQGAQWSQVGPGLQEEGAGKQFHWTLQGQKDCGTQFIILELTERFGANHSLEFAMQTPLRNLGCLMWLAEGWEFYCFPLESQQIIPTF